MSDPYESIRRINNEVDALERRVIELEASKTTIFGEVKTVAKLIEDLTLLVAEQEKVIAALKSDHDQAMSVWLNRKEENE
jgi:predicted  nucleic acid-binding Zn-ribbon protein